MKHRHIGAKNLVPAPTVVILNLFSTLSKNEGFEKQNTLTIPKTITRDPMNGQLGSKKRLQRAV
jgi:hypothetical protein